MRGAPTYEPLGGGQRQQRHRRVPGCPVATPESPDARQEQEPGDSTILAIGLAGVNGGLLALADPTITQSPNAPRIVTAIVVVAMLSMFAHNKGDADWADDVSDSPGGDMRLDE